MIRSPAAKRTHGRRESRRRCKRDTGREDPDEDPAGRAPSMRRRIHLPHRNVTLYVTVPDPSGLRRRVIVNAPVTSVPVNFPTNETLYVLPPDALVSDAVNLTSSGV